MLGLVLIYFIGKPFYELAEEHHKSKWGFAILGVVCYYVGTFLLGVVIEIAAPGTVETMNTFVLSAIGIPAGLFTSWICYIILKNQWNKVSDNNDDNTILDGDLNNFN